MESNVDRESRPSPLSSLIASARRLTSATIGAAKSSQWGRSGNMQQGWQEDAWEMYDLVGEERFLASTLSGRLSQARLYVGKLSKEDPSDDPTPVEDHAINAILQSIGDSQSGRSQILKRLATNLFIAGDGWLVGVPPFVKKKNEETQKLEEVKLSDLIWHMLSVSEVSRVSLTGVLKLNIGEDGGEVEVNPDDVYLIRIWRAHPRRWWEADSPTRACLPILKELVGLTMHVSAQVDSRLAGAGILVVPASAQRALQIAAGETEESATDQFTEALMEAMLTPIADRSAASALVPLVVTVPDESAEKFQHISFASSLDGEAKELREEAIRRLALGQDAPPELLLGTSGMNHWGAWLTMEETVTTHIEPPLALICDALTTQYLWPVLEQMHVEDHESYVIWYDIRHMITRPSAGSDALALHERDVISDDALRRTLGFDDDDAPEKQDDKDKVAEIVTQMVQQNPALISRPGLAIIMEQLSAVLAGQEPPVYDPMASRRANPVDGTAGKPVGEVDGKDAAPANGQEHPANGTTTAPGLREPSTVVTPPKTVAPPKVLQP